MLKIFKQKRFLVIALVLTSLITGCGLKGPLYQEQAKQQENNAKQEENEQQEQNQQQKQ